MKLVQVEQRFPSHALADVAASVRAEMAGRRVGSTLPRGARVAVAAGSRGVGNIAVVVGEVVAHFRAAGLEPFIVPAMGSHGAATAEGQAAVLAGYGITESAMGVPVRSSLDVVELGRTPGGIDIVFDREAWNADAVFFVNRVKWHTTFEAPVESGLMKMAAIGIGKLRGAQTYHAHIVRRGFYDVILDVGRHVLATGKVLGGLAILEDAHHATAQVTALAANEIEHEEPRLLALVKSWMPKLLFPEIDILIVDEMGKHVSGVGMDSKVINRHPYGAVNPWNWLPKILRIYVRDVKHGNANGVGMADMISERAYAAIDWKSTRVNGLTANNLASIRTPLRAHDDEEAMDVLCGSVGRLNRADVTCVQIRNTLELTKIHASENLLNPPPPGVEPVY